MTAAISIRFAEPKDLDFIYTSFVELFTEANVLERFSQTKDSLSQALFSRQPFAEVLIGEINKRPISLALFSMTNRNFTLFNGPGLFLHDLYVQKEHRRKGVGTKLIHELNKIAQTRAYCRIDFVLLKNNELGHHFFKVMQNAKPVEYIQYMRINID